MMLAMRNSMFNPSQFLVKLMLVKVLEDVMKK